MNQKLPSSFSPPLKTEEGFKQQQTALSTYYLIVGNSVVALRKAGSPFKPNVIIRF